MTMHASLSRKELSSLWKSTTMTLNLLLDNGFKWVRTVRVSKLHIIWVSPRLTLQWLPKKKKTPSLPRWKQKLNSSLMRLNFLLVAPYQNLFKPQSLIQLLRSMIRQSNIPVIHPNTERIRNMAPRFTNGKYQMEPSPLLTRYSFAVLVRTGPLLLNVPTVPALMQIAILADLGKPD